MRRKPDTYPAGMPMLRNPAIMMWLKSWQTPWRAANASANGVSTSVASGSYRMSRWIAWPSAATTSARRAGRPASSPSRRRQRPHRAARGATVRGSEAAMQDRGSAPPRFRSPAQARRWTPPWLVARDGRSAPEDAASPRRSIRERQSRWPCCQRNRPGRCARRVAGEYRDGLRSAAVRPANRQASAAPDACRR